METLQPTLTVVTSDGRELFFFDRGILPLWRLYKESPAALRGAFVNDKVTGLGAAVVMVEAGVGSYHTGVMSEDAKAYCDKHGLQGKADVVVPFIINWAGTGRCPLETRLSKCDERSYLSEIEAFVKSIWPTDNEAM